jgi:hypothetical protein
MIADLRQARLRIAEHIDELETWLQDGMTDNDDVRLVVCMLSQAQRQLRVMNMLLAVSIDNAALTRLAYARGCEVLNWGWVWTA